MVKKCLLFLFLSSALLLTACSGADRQNTDTSGQIYLYGEQHGSRPIYEKELELWKQYYENDQMRHLFVEMSYYSAEFLNQWMQAEDDTILLELFADWEGTASDTEDNLEFLRAIKAECPETVFHGFDVGHQYETTGQRFLAQLEDDGKSNSEEYRLALDNAEQGAYYYSTASSPINPYREMKMAENFIREYENLDREPIMGICGSAHIQESFQTENGPIDSMGFRLKERYGDMLLTEDLSGLAKDIPAVRTETLTAAGKKYEASFFGTQDLTGFFPDYVSRDFWRLENAYEDFKDLPKNGQVLPYSNYPMQIETGQVFVVDYTKTDGSVERHYYRSDGRMWNKEACTEEVTTDE